MKRIFKFIVVGVATLFSIITLSACSISEVFNKAIDTALLEEEVKELKYKIISIEEILEENGFIVISEETADGLVWSIVEKPEEDEDINQEDDSIEELNDEDGE